MSAISILTPRTEGDGSWVAIRWDGTQEVLDLASSTMEGFTYYVENETVYPDDSETFLTAILLNYWIVQDPMGWIVAYEDDLVKASFEIRPLS